MRSTAFTRVFTRASGAATVVLTVIALAVVFAVMRFAIPTTWAQVTAQVVFLAPILGAAVFLARAAAQAPSRSRSRRVWVALTCSALSLFVSEASVSHARLFTSEAHRVLSELFDAANGLAVLAIGVAVVLRARVDRFGWRRAGRIVLDLVALVALTFGLQYRFWASHAGGPVAAGGGPAYLSAYGALGLLLLLGSVASFGHPALRVVPYNALIAWSIALTGVGVELSVISGALQAGQDGLIHAASSVVLLIAYGLMCGAGWLRLNSTGTVVPGPNPVRPPSVWPGVLVSGLVFVSVAWLGILALESEPGSQAEAVYLAAATIAAVSVVGRTGLAYAEVDELTERSMRDPLTGVLGPRAFHDELGAFVGRATRSGTVAVFCVDIDDFSRLNAVDGYRSGDRCLVAVARALEGVSEVERLFRLTGDEFVALCMLRDPADAERVARGLLVAVRSCECTASVTASVGFAVLGGEVEHPEDLLRCARLAGLWAKRHGKDRAIRYDRRIGETLTLDERLARPSERARMDMAKALLAAADARDPANHWHARNVAALARLLGEDLGLDAAHVDRVEMAAILHDVGKIALPDVMLGGRTLTFQERSVAREHVRLGERLVESLAVEGVGRWIRSHHENWDGTGYPDGLAGEHIPLESRIIALADAYDGMTMGKRYGAPMSKAAALQEIDLGIGVRFDPDLAERFIRVVGSTDALGWSDEWPSS